MSVTHRKSSCRSKYAISRVKGINKDNFKYDREINELKILKPYIKRNFTYWWKKLHDFEILLLAVIEFCPELSKETDCTLKTLNSFVSEWYLV